MFSLIKLLVVWILVILLIISFVSNVHASNDLADESQSNQLPFCDEHETQHKGRNVALLYVSTLDGKVSALDIFAEGETKWTLNTTPGQMISSSIHDIELTNNGKWVRMIPSLSGSIYKFDGDSVEPIPINADNLLSSTFKYSDELVISGGKETISYGVSANSGRVIYECSMRGCVNNTHIESSNGESNNEIPSYADEHEANVDDEVIIVRRQTQTVRAIEPRTGEERWNFSVGHHELESVNSRSDCHSSFNKRTEILLELMKDVELKVIVPEGLICAVRKDAPHTILWKTKFDHPIVNVWRRDENNQLKMIDLFRTAHEMWQFQGNSWTQTNEASIRKEAVNGFQMPSIYVGMYKRQLYIQESDHLRSIRMKLVDHIMDDVDEHDDKVARIPWRPIEASSSSLLQIEFHGLNENPLTATESSEVAIINRKDHSDTATSILYGSEYVNGNGYYLYSESTSEKMCDRENESGSVPGSMHRDPNTNIINETIGDDIDDYRTTPVINVVSIWYWWREISLIALSAFIFNFLLTKKAAPEPEVVIVERHVEIKVPATPEPADDNYLLPAIEYQPKRSLSESNGNDGSENSFHSRFQTDFNMLECLGKGGFGVVFEAKNLIDDCNYAIKRIVLPKNKQSRERVMREVKTLANCEHQNIVRYFQAWVESPPPGWQEKEDNIWMDHYGLSSHLIDIDSPTSEEPSHSFHPNKASQVLTKRVRSQAYNKNKLDFLIAGLHTNECVNFDEDVRKTNFGNEDDADESDDSFIVFANDDNDEKNMDKSDASSDDGESKVNNNDDLSNSVFDRSSADCVINNILGAKKSTANRPHFFHGTSKPSSFSVNGSPIVIKDKNCEISINLSDDECDNESEHNRKKKILPFKPTHRRPLSLDLTSTGSVQMPTVNATKSLSYLYIQMQLCRKESLKDWLVQNGASIRLQESHNIFRQIVEAVEYVHLKGLIHRDLKPSNIFFSLDGRVKIGDFGLVTDMAENLKSITQCGDPSCAKHTQQVGTHLYMSPEQLQGRPYNYKVDIYSLGLILFELLMVFGTEMERIQTIKSLRSVKFPNGFQDEFQHEHKLLQLMLSKNPNERPTTYGIRARPPFSEPSDKIYHFELPPRRRESQTFSSGFGSSSSSSNSSGANLNSAQNRMSL